VLVGFSDFSFAYCTGNPITTTTAGCSDECNASAGPAGCLADCEVINKIYQSYNGANWSHCLYFNNIEGPTYGWTEAWTGSNKIGYILVPTSTGYPLLWGLLYDISTCPSGQKHDENTGICITNPTCDSTHCTETAVNALKNNGKPCPSLSCGNPINIGVGNKYQPESDYQGAGDFPLVFERVYNSSTTNSFALGLGSHWLHSYERSIAKSSSATYATAYREDGKAYTFTLVGSNWLPVVDVNLQLIPTSNPSGWQLTLEDGSVETYDTHGKLQSIKNRAGATHTLSYDTNGHLVTITHSNGRSLSLSYDSYFRVASLQDSAGGRYQYGYDKAINGNLVSVTYPDQTVRTYLYNETANTSGANLPHALTGIIDENGSRYATFQYDTQGRAITSQHNAGAQVVEKVSVSYGANSRTIIDALGTSRITNLQTQQGVVKNSGQIQPIISGGSTASNLTYDANGNVSSRIDFNGNRTNYSYDLTRNLETSRTEGLTASGATTPATRTITTLWHPTFRLPVQITNANQQTTYGYNPQGDITDKTVTDLAANTSRHWTTTYTYGTVPGVLLQKVEDGPRIDLSDLTIYDYYPADATCTGGHLGCRGQLQQITDALGHHSQLTRYSAHGQVEEFTDPNDLVTTMTYDSRQRLTSLDVGGETTTYTYDPAGQLTRVTGPDGAYLAYSYDAAHRLIKTQDNLGNTLSYTLDAMGNRTQEEAYDPGGQLARSQSRVYDALSRLQNRVQAQ
jgi:YD repeat-containing protein